MENVGKYRKCPMLLGLIAMLCLFSLPLRVSADMGPKPSVVINFKGLEEEKEYYVTLLSQKAATGPWSTEEEYAEYLGDEAAFEKFKEYEDEDGYYFLGYMNECSDADRFTWGYYPPEKFKILVYFPEHDSFLMVDEIQEQYAFDSYFTVEVTNAEATVSTDTIDTTDSADTTPVPVKVNISYDYTREVESFIARVIATIVIELLVALLFMYREKRALAIIAGINMLTQIILNILLNIGGGAALLFNYLWMECVVFIIEAIIYDKLIGRENKAKNVKYYPYRYAAVANIASFMVGILVAALIPGMF